MGPKKKSKGSLSGRGEGMSLPPSSVTELQDCYFLKLCFFMEQGQYSYFYLGIEQKSQHRDLNPIPCTCCMFVFFVRVYGIRLPSLFPPQDKIRNSALFPHQAGIGISTLFHVSFFHFCLSLQNTEYGSHLNSRCRTRQGSHPYSVFFLFQYYVFFLN